METIEEKNKHSPLDVTKESIKLVHNSKGYTWEIKLISMNTHIEDQDFSRLNNIDNKLSETYGRGE
jgi:hypothetical protein